MAKSRTKSRVGNILERRTRDVSVFWDRRKSGVSRVVTPKTVLGLATLLSALPISKVVIIAILVIALVLLT